METEVADLSSVDPTDRDHITNALSDMETMSDMLMEWACFVKAAINHNEEELERALNRIEELSKKLMEEDK